MKVLLRVGVQDGTLCADPYTARIVLDLAEIPLPGDLVGPIAPVGPVKIIDRRLIPIGQEDYVAEVVAADVRCVPYLSKREWPSITEALEGFGWI